MQISFSVLALAGFRVGVLLQETNSQEKGMNSLLDLAGLAFLCKSGTTFHAPFLALGLFSIIGSSSILVLILYICASSLFYFIIFLILFYFILLF